jgi:hypothetical protein
MREQHAVVLAEEKRVTGWNVNIQPCIPLRSLVAHPRRLVPPHRGHRREGVKPLTQPRGGDNHDRAWGANMAASGGQPRTPPGRSTDH